MEKAAICWCFDFLIFFFFDFVLQLLSANAAKHFLLSELLQIFTELATWVFLAYPMPSVCV